MNSPKVDLIILDKKKNKKKKEQRKKKRSPSGSRTRFSAAHHRPNLPLKRSCCGSPAHAITSPEELASLSSTWKSSRHGPRPTFVSSRCCRAIRLRLTRPRELQTCHLVSIAISFSHLAPAKRHAPLRITAEKEGLIQLKTMGDSISIQHVFDLVLRLKHIANFDHLTGESAKLELL